ncbi:unnamed protein product [Protopolystoma xenopodis]|uniref:Uncharacterized protein n=1 Tax=Protopolystoma xenopodis TaxID=117903 RepID=A0A3S5ACB7_9PLAT|nr:unnamed protein product [Protopolystoma xenopodis]
MASAQREVVMEALVEEDSVHQLREEPVSADTNYPLRPGKEFLCCGSASKTSQHLIVFGARTRTMPSNLFHKQSESSSVANPCTDAHPNDSASQLHDVTKPRSAFVSCLDVSPYLYHVSSASPEGSQ